MMTVSRVKKKDGEKSTYKRGLYIDVYISTKHISSVSSSSSVWLDIHLYL